MGVIRTARGTRVFIPSERPSGRIELEGRLHLPDDAGQASGVVICHPHPAGGGEMGVTFIRHLAEELSSHGFAALRFNFGGVGRSSGTFTDGVEEPWDVAAAFDYVKAVPGVDIDRVSLVGWSFGSWMALMALADGLEALSCAAIAPPLVAYDWSEYAPRIAASTAKRYYIVGDEDQFCPVDALREFAAAVSEDDAQNVTELPGADHFLFGREPEIVHLLVELLAD